MSTSIVLSRDHVYPAAAILSLLWLPLWQVLKIGRARARSGIQYPQVYAEKAEVAASKEANVFNCIQRAHQNTLEFLPSIVFSTVITSVQHPLVAASLCGTWTLSRIIYTIGYSTGDPDRRNALQSARLGMILWLGLLITSIWSVIGLWRDTL